MIKLKYIPFYFLIIINLIAIYLMIDLSNYDELAAFLNTGDKVYSSPKKRAWATFLTLVFNLFFVCVSLMKTIMFPENWQNKHKKQ